MERNRKLKKKTSLKKSAPSNARHLVPSSQIKSGIPEFCLDEDDKAAREESDHEDAVCSQKRERGEADISEAPAKKKRVALINSRKLIYKVIRRVKLPKFGENLIEKTEMIVNRKSCDFTNIACHTKTDVTKVIHANMEMGTRTMSQRSQKSKDGRNCMTTIFVDDVHEASIIPPTGSKSGETCAADENHRICGWKQQQVQCVR